jgi:hypothetical protein
VKRILAGAVAACALTAMVLVAPPASADSTLKQHCEPYYGPSGSKALWLCTNTMSDTNSPQHRYGKSTINLIAGHDLPYAVHVKTIFWSKYPGGSWCAGQASYVTCTNGGGVGNANDIFRPAVSTDFNDTQHYADDEHYCTFYVETIGEIYWTQPNWNSGTYDSYDQQTGQTTENTHCIDI